MEPVYVAIPPSTYYDSVGYNSQDTPSTRYSRAAGYSRAGGYSRYLPSLFVPSMDIIDKRVS